MTNNANAILEGLNDEQRRAVESVDGPVLIVAGAGSGKTRVLTSRIAYILEGGCDPSGILALTFTKKAASEMKERIGIMVGERRARRLCMGTFHSVFIRFLREYADRLGYPEKFTIYDQSDSQNAIKACIKELQLDDKIYKPRDVLSRISMAKNNLVTSTAYRNNPNALMTDTHSRKPRICDIYSLYAQKCKASGVMDFDDILLNMNILFRDHPDALEAIAARFNHVLVDEYQDTNLAQYLILKKLCMHHHNLCVVGDDSQSIYAFRGAKIENILNFKKDYPESRTFRLERNYRSTQMIVDAANSLIAKNQGRIPKECYAVGEKGEKIRLLRSYTEQEEARRITSEIISKMQAHHAQYQDFAILYRTNSQSRALEEALRMRNIPYMIYSGNSFFERAEVKDMMAYFKLVVNPLDDESFKRVVNKPARGIGGTSMDALEAIARAHQTSLFRAAYADDAEAHGLKAAAVARIRAFCDTIDKMTQMVSTTDAQELARQIADASGLYRFYKEDTSVEGQSRTANIEELMSSCAQFVEQRQNELIEELELDPDIDEVPLVTLDAFLENISLLSNVDVQEDEDTNNRVALMTVHTAKGLEFPYVFVTGMEENLFPSGSMLMSSDDIEEERRLFYVAVTRAKRTVDLSFSRSRMRNGKTESNGPSRFLKEIDPEFIENPLTDEDMDVTGLSDGGFGGFGSRFGQRGSGSSYGTRTSYGSGASYGSQRSSGAARPASSRPSAPRPQQAAPARPAASSSRPSAPPPVRYDEATFIPALMSDFAAGQKIEHNRFGPGKILEITGKVPELKARIQFDDFAEPKTILLKYAKMRIVK